MKVPGTILLKNLIRSKPENLMLKKMNRLALFEFSVTGMSKRKVFKWVKYAGAKVHGR